MAAAEAIALDMDGILHAIIELRRAHAGLGDQQTAEVLEAVAGLLQQQQADLAELMDQRHGLNAENQRLRQELARWRPVATIRRDPLQTTFRVCVGGECQSYQLNTREYEQMGMAARYIAAGAMIKGLYQAAVAAIIPTEVSHV